MISAPILKYFDYNRHTCVETNASNGVLAGVMCQEYDDGWHLVAFYLQSIQGAELNYPIYDKELMVVIYFLQEWRLELVGL